MRKGTFRDLSRAAGIRYNYSIGLKMALRICG